MSEWIYSELLFFWKTVGTGAFFLFFYDSFSALRRVISHSALAEWIENLIFWILSSLQIFVLIDRENGGVMRGFVIFGILLGIWLNFKIFHDFSLHCWIRFWNMTVNHVKKMRKRLLFSKKQCKIYLYKFAKWGKIGENLFGKSKRGSQSEKQSEGTRQKTQGE